MDDAARDTIGSWLDWYREIGADEAIDAAPRRKQPDTAAPDPSTASWSAAARPAPAVPRPDLVTARPIAQSAHGVEADAAARAAACASLEELEAAVRGFDGCALKLTAKSTVFADGATDAPLMIVGEAPGEEEDRQGLPFVGPAGKLLDRMLAAIGRDRTNTLITNVVYWRPPGNRQPTTSELALCLPFVRRHIALVRPKVLVFAGNISAKALSGRAEGITRLRGQWIEFPSEPAAPAIAAVAIYHPAYLLRVPSQKRDAWRDLLAINERLEKAK